MLRLDRWTDVGQMLELWVRGRRGLLSSPPEHRVNPVFLEQCVGAELHGPKNMRFGPYPPPVLVTHRMLQLWNSLQAVSHTALLLEAIKDLFTVLLQVRM